MEVVATAPVRVADAGGWTDTWFAGHGLVCNVAVEPGVTVKAAGRPGAPATVEVCLVGSGDRYRYPAAHPPGHQPLLEAAIARHGPDGSLTVAVDSAVPPGSGVGTSAAVTVALVGALAVLGGASIDREAVARAAHEVETIDLGQQSGVQDQLASAFGGVSLITITAFPDATVARLPLSRTTWVALAERFLTVYLGQPHDSSGVHEEVIAELTADPARGERLEPLRRAADAAAAALVAGDFVAYGAALTANNDAQAGLHPALVSTAAQQVIELARKYGALGAKVNGAGGDGGSVTIVCGDDTVALRLAVTDRSWRVLPLIPSAAGLRVEQAL